MKHSSYLRSPALSTLLLIACLLASGSMAEPVFADEGGPESRSGALSDGFAQFIAGLDAAQSKKARYDFEDAERFDLRLAPLGLEGLRIDEMTDEQWSHLEDLLGSVLSPEGLAKMNTIRSLEREVAELEGGVFGFLMDRIRKVGRYFLSVYGMPSKNEAWGMRFDGHHLSLNWTSVPGAALSVTPLFFGGQPRVVPNGLDRVGLRVLEDEEKRAVDFINGLTDGERERAYLPWVEGSAIRRPMSIGGEVDLALPARSGLARADLSEAARERLDALVEVHLANFRPAIAERFRRRLLGAGGEHALTFVYAAAVNRPDAPIESGKAIYYRIQGGDILIEFDNTSEAADHIHVVLRDTRTDFGRDALAEHRSAHHTQ